MDHSITAFLVFVAFASGLNRSPEAEPIEDPLADPKARWARWRFHLEENAIDGVLQSLSETHRPQALAVADVTVSDPATGTNHHGMTVLTEGGRIHRVGSRAEVEIPDGYMRVEGRGRFLLPGLTDMHVHSLVSSSQKLLNLANGVTTVRDLDGFPWLLRERDAIRSNKLLAPNLYLSGHILNAMPMDFFATVVRTPEAARKAVREQHRLGYDFIKVHNRMRVDVYRAVIEEARALRLDVVGHVPQELSLQEAIALGQRTFEHLKGFYLDRTLELSSENYPQLVQGADIWICPTLYTVRMGLRGQEVLDFIDHSPEVQYVSRYDRLRWRETYSSASEDASSRVYALSQTILRNLTPATTRFLAGTDTGGGYDLMVPGFALHQEMRLLAENGLNWLDVLRSATTNPAAAMRHEAEFGAILPGLRADFVVLEADPLDGPESLKRIAGVVVRGIWLSRAALDRMLADVATIYAHAGEDLSPREPTREEIDALVRDRLDLAARGFVHRDHQLEELAKLLGSAGHPEDARKITALRTTPEGVEVY